MYIYFWGKIDIKIKDYINMQSSELTSRKVDNMVEDVGKIISNGFETYTRNLNLSIPFILNVFVTGLLAAIFVIAIFFSLGPSLSSLENAGTPEAFISVILSIITKHLLEIVIMGLAMVLIITFAGAFFMAGAIGMAKQATETGKTDLSTMVEAGKKNGLNLFLAEILVGLLLLAGIVFMVPGAMKVNISQLLSHENTGAAILLIGGFLLWIIYSLILSLVLAVFSYALVIDDLNPIEGITTGFSFFKKHMLDVFLIWIIIGAIAFALGIIGQLIGMVPILAIIWFIIDTFISIVIFQPLMTVWWVRLYMTRTGEPVYYNDLLFHPGELSKS